MEVDKLWLFTTLGFSEEEARKIEELLAIRDWVERYSRIALGIPCDYFEVGDDASKTST